MNTKWRQIRVVGTYFLATQNKNKNSRRYKSKFWFYFTIIIIVINIVHFVFFCIKFHILLNFPIFFPFDSSTTSVRLTVEFRCCCFLLLFFNGYFTPKNKNLWMRLGQFSFPISIFDIKNNWCSSYFCFIFRSIFSGPKRFNRINKFNRTFCCCCCWQLDFILNT